MLANDLSLSIEKRTENIQKAQGIVSEQPNDSLNRVNLFKVANRYYNIGNWNEYNKIVQLVLENSENLADSNNIAKANSYLGDYYVAQAVSDSAFLYYYKAEKIYNNINDSINLGKTVFNKASLLYKVGDFLGGEKESIKVLRIVKGKNYNNNNILYDTYNLLGLIYNELGDFDAALNFNNKALSVIDDKKIPPEFQSRATSYNNIGYLYLSSKNYKQARFFFQKGLQQNNLKIQKPYLYAILLDNLGYSMFKLNEMDRIPDLFYESLKLNEALNVTAGVFISKIHLAEYFAAKNEYDKALKYSKEAFLLSRSTNNPRDVLVSLKQLVVIDPKKSAFYNREYIRINEELQKQERKVGEKFSRIEYETDAIKDQNSTLELQNRNLVYAFSILTILGLFIYIVKAQKTKNRELLYKQRQQKANEDIYNLMISQQNTIETSRVKEKKRVAQELHDGVLGRMFGVRMNLDSLNKFQDDQAISQRDSYLSELKNIEQDIREISHDLNREKSELINNFVAIVDNLLEEQRKTFPAKVVSIIDSSIKWDKVLNSVKINLYRIIQESLQNCNKYANATSIKVELKRKDDTIVLLISDNGIGFNTNAKKKGIGLQNMISRTQECNGIFDVSSTKGQGSTITVTIPTELKQIPA
jgi:signal transduction histidine kinase